MNDKQLIEAIARALSLDHLDDDALAARAALLAMSERRQQTILNKAIALLKTKAWTFTKSCKA